MSEVRVGDGALTTLHAAIPALACAGLAALAYAGAVQWMAPELSLALPLLAVFVAAMISSVAGFAFAPVSAVMLIHLVDDPLRMVSMIITASIMVQLLCVLNRWRDMDWPGALVVATGGLATLPLGLLLLLEATGRAHVMSLGALLVAYAAWMMWRPHAVQAGNPSRWAQVMVGAAGGITGGMAGFPAGPLVAWCGWLGMGRVALWGITQPYILVMQVAALLLLQWLAPARGQMAGFDPTLLLVAGPALFGTACGLQLHGVLSDRNFARLMNAMLLAAGLGMLL
ncbi:TSUP family transporter [Sediminicoccus sp. KRV36]|uniref:TSUP family transporter n=1 Tax=Sediminicoccus sp. KRV36 TaxID=3133721 RepID=UPI00200BBF08|nr:TSUP family transporter [Sediminicoccus rosea]UPY37867.1 TSUP family transporter [Sediminicoccus rosea]